MTTSGSHLNKQRASGIAQRFAWGNPASTEPYYRSDNLIVLLESFNVCGMRNKDGPSSSAESLVNGNPTP